MTIKFRDASEAKKVAAARKETRPTYYNADVHKDVEISEDFEAALILIPASAREEARQRLGAQTTATDRVQKRDSILQAALQVEYDNAIAQTEELNEKMSSLQSFKSKFASYAEVGEIGLLLRDAQIEMDETILAYDRAKHRLVCCVVLADRVSTGSVSAEIDQERQSWSNVLTEYSGI